MKPFAKILIAATAVSAILSVRDYSTAEINAQDSVPVTAQSGLEHPGEPMPTPVTGGQLFAELGPDPDSSAEVCMPVGQILDIFALDVEAVGGEILSLSGGLEQEFADQWRRAVGMSPVDVSQVYAHVVPGLDGDAIVDVVEVDAEGCALSRTLLSHADWLDLLGIVQGIDV
jgi:hypothetical protein